MDYLSHQNYNGNRLDSPTYTLPAFMPGGRLTLTSGTPVTTADVTGATAIRYTPYRNNMIPQWDGTRFKFVTFTEQTINISGLTSGVNYDFFISSFSGGVPSLNVRAWSSNTARNVSNPLNLQNGLMCLDNTPYNLYVGTMRTTGTNTTEDSFQKRFLWNYYNQVGRLFYSGSSASHTYTTATWRQFNAGVSMPMVEWVQGYEDNAVRVDGWYNLYQGFCGMYLNATSGNPVQRSIGGCSASTVAWVGTATLNRGPTLGYNFVQVAEQGGGASGNFFGAELSGTIMG